MRSRMCLLLSIAPLTWGKLTPLSSVFVQRTYSVIITAVHAYKLSWGQSARELFELLHPPQGRPTRTWRALGE